MSENKNQTLLSVGNVTKNKSDSSKFYADTVITGRFI